MEPAASGAQYRCSVAFYGAVRTKSAPGTLFRQARVAFLQVKARRPLLSALDVIQDKL